MDQGGRIVDLFGGPGGWSEALRALGMAEVGLEMDPRACATRGAAGHLTIRCNVAEYATQALGRVWGLIGSPPCPTFSAAGKREGVAELGRLRAHIYACIGGWVEPDPPDTWSDPRTPLVLQPLRYALDLAPEWIALEQVPSVLPIWQSMAVVLEANGYGVWCGEVDAVNYGVPQHRKRAILIANRGLPRRPAPTHSPDRWVTMAEALGWGMTERPYPSIAPGTSAGGADSAGLGGSGARDAVNLERDEGRWVIRTNQPTSATGEPYERSTDEPSPTVTGGARQWEVEGVEVVERHQLGFPRRDDRGTSEDGYRDRDWFEADEPSLTITEKARSFTHRIVRSVNTGRDWKPGEDRSHAQTIDPHEQPAPAVTAKSGGQWQLNPGATASRPEQAARRSADVANRRHYELDEPAPTIAFGHDAAAWCWQRPATTVAGDPRVWPPGHKVNQSDRDRLGEAEANEKYGDRAGTEAIRLEVHEAALLQTFPVDYPWQGNRTSQFQQVGNAVPPLLGFHVLVEAMTVRRRPAPARRLEPHGDAEAVALF